MTTTVDAIVVGLGPGGESAATQLANAGLSVVGVDRRLVGGECPYFGCVPSKMMIRAANALAEAHRVDGLAGSTSVAPDWSPVARRISEEATDDWDDTVAVERLVEAGVRFVRGHGRLTAPGVVDVDGESFEASRAIILNTGTEPGVPPIPGLADVPFWTNRDAVRLTELPDSLIVIGGGSIGAELAQVFARFGVQVTVVEVADRLLALEEPESGALLAEVFAREAIQVLTGASIDRVTYADGRFTLAMGDTSVSADQLLVAAGRRNNLADIGLEHIGARPVHAGDRDRRAAARGSSGCGRSATSPARGRSPTCRCTRRPSRCVRCSGGAARGPTTGQCPG